MSSLALPAELLDHPRYRILRELGHGGMGTVYEAEHRLMNRRVALKVLAPGLLNNPQALERFRAEVCNAARLTHPNIVTAYDADQAGDLHFLVMEYVEGIDLARLVEQRGPLPVGMACHFIRQAALGLQHAHEQGLIHRDLKPHNLMLTSKGQVKILDFGLARLSDRPRQGPALTKLESFLGTPEYVAPEQALDARKADIRSDIYSLGCSLYFLLTGRPPFVGATEVQVVLAQVEQEARPVHEVEPGVPGALSAVVARLLAKDPGQRYQVPAEVVKALTPFIQDHSSPVKEKPPSVASKVRTAATILPGKTDPLLKVQKETQAQQSPLLVKEPGPGAAAGYEEVPEKPVKPRTRKKVGGRKPPSRDKWLRENWWILVVAGGMAFLVLLGIIMIIQFGGKGEGLAGISTTQKITTQRAPGPVISPPDDPPVKNGITSKVGEIPPVPAVPPTNVPVVRELEPRRAIAPFDAAKAKEYQRLWAEHLKVPVETTNKIGMKFVLIPPGTFLMGSSPIEKDRSQDEAQHRVTLTKGFYLGVYEVTQAQWQAVMGGNPSFSKGDNLPVEGVTWDDCQEFCKKLSAQEGKSYRLPTEAEWEYGCRAGTTTAFCFGDEVSQLGEYAWYWDNNNKRTNLVGQKKANAWGLYDMHGNVFEWCQDWYGNYDGDAVDPVGPGWGSLRVFRGGGWGDGPRSCRSAVRFWLGPGDRFGRLGCRLALVPSGVR